jgi:Family of unknown function (DUF6502)
MQTAVPTDQTANHALEACERMLRPIMRLALDRGLKYQDIDELIRELMLDEATLAWEKVHSKAPSGSQLSVTTGINRKEIKRRLIVENAANRMSKAKVSLAAQVFTAWVRRSEEDSSTKKIHVLRQLDKPSFQELAETVGKDVHFRSVLDELLRLGLANEIDGFTELTANNFVPRKDLLARLDISADNAAAHLSAMSENLARPDAAFLEQAIWANKLSPQACSRILAEARAAWAQAHKQLYEKMVTEPEADTGAPIQRIRIGMYSYAEDMPQGEEQ